MPLDTGFLVHNDRTYPNLVRLFREIGIATSQASDMCFAVSCRRTGLEIQLPRRPRLLCAEHVTCFVRPTFAPARHPAIQSRGAGAARRERMPTARRSATSSSPTASASTFRRLYLYPMASAIWSTSLDAIRSFPALTLIRFLDNHGLLSLSAQPTWKVVVGGSQTYIPKLMARFSGNVHEGASILAVRRSDGAVTVAFRDRPSMTFDDVVFACHGDQVLPLLADPSDRERDVFAGFTTTTNVAWLHTDTSVLPVRTAARASWNYLLAADADAPPTVTYHLNRLQRLTTPERYRVTLNPDVRSTNAVCCAASSIATRCTRARPSARSGSGVRSAASIARTTAAPTGPTAFTKMG